MLRKLTSSALVAGALAFGTAGTASADNFSFSLGYSNYGGYRGGYCPPSYPVYSAPVYSAPVYSYPVYSAPAYPVYASYPSYGYRSSYRVRGDYGRPYYYGGSRGGRGYRDRCD